VADPEIQLDRLKERTQTAIERFWGVRARQGERQGLRTGRRDAGSRTEVTGGNHLDAISDLIAECVIENCPSIVVHRKPEPPKMTTLPGYFRPTKNWDLLLMLDRQLVGCVELKSQVGSFGNNYNNRTEEAVGSACDLHTAYREGAYRPSPQPYLGYLMVLQDCPQSTTPLTRPPHEQHFPIAADFRGNSYAERYENTISRLVREKLYSSGCLILTNRTNGSASWHEPNKELTFRRLVAGLIGHALATSASS